MSQYNGFLKRLSGIKGDFKRENLNINVEIHPENKKRNLSFSIPAKYGIKFVNSTVFSGAVKKINGIYRFIVAKVKLIMGHKAKQTTAPAKLVDVDSTVQMGNEAPLDTHPANGISVDQKERVSVYARLVAYRRAGCRYIKKLFFKRKAELQAAPGAVAKYAETLNFKRTSKAIAADSTIMESRYNTILHSYEATGSSAPAQIVPETESIFSAEHTAGASTGATVGVNNDSSQKVTHNAKIATWIEPVVIDGVLYLRQTYSATLENDVLVVR